MVLVVPPFAHSLHIARIIVFFLVIFYVHMTGRSSHCHSEEGAPAIPKRLHVPASLLVHRINLLLPSGYDLPFPPHP
jgi:hypothetical protein